MRAPITGDIYHIDGALRAQQRSRCQAFGVALTIGKSGWDGCNQALNGTDINEGRVLSLIGNGDQTGRL